MSQPHQSTGERLREHLTRKRVIGYIVTVILVGMASYYFEDIKQLFPDLVTLQLYAYNHISRLSNPGARKDWVVGVEIDDQAFFQFLKLTGEQDVTDRAFLAELVDAAVRARAAVIALDINLVADADDKSDACRREGNRALFDAIARATAANIPVVLTQGFDYRTMTPLENIQDGAHTADALPPAPPAACSAADPRDADPRAVSIVDCRLPRDETAAANPYHVRAGFDLVPEDRRKVPLVTITNQQVECKSFALHTAEAYNQVMKWPPILPRLAAKTEGGQEFVYAEVLSENSHLAAASETTLLQRMLDKIDIALGLSKPAGASDQYQFDHFPALEVHENRNNRDWLTRNLDHRIVLIGGHRHAHATAEGASEGSDWVDYHVGPSGAMVGMYINANYIQGLLDNHTPYPIGRWTGVAIDVGIALFVILIELLWVEQRWHRLVILVLGAALLVLTHRIVTIVHVSIWIRLGIYLLLLAAIWRMASRTAAHKRILTMLLAFVVVALTYIVATLLGYGLDVLAVLLILIAHDLYDRHLQKQERYAELARGTNA